MHNHVFLSWTVLRGLAPLAVLLGLAGCGPSVDPRFQQADAFDALSARPPEYRIGPGDDLSVVLPFNPELNYEGPVGPDGRFTMPLAGSLTISGKTVSEVEADISQALTDRHITLKPQVSISIRRYAQVVYVDGEVKQPGAFPLQNNMDPLQAITVAGGVLDTARTYSVVIIRRGPDGRPVLRVVDLEALIHEGDPAQAVALRAQDTIFVPKTSIAEVDLWIDQYINKALPFQRGFSYAINNNSPANTVTPATAP